MNQEVAKKQSRPKRSELMQVQCEKGEMAQYVRHALASFNLPPLDISDIEQVKERCEWYFNHCIDGEMRPTVAGLCNALGINRTTFHRWCVGSERRNTHMEYMNRVKSVMEELMETYMQTGRINPVSGIFLLKNNFGYQDKSEIVLTPNQQPEVSATPEELWHKYVTAGASEFDALDDM